ncbi:MAG: NAD-dependent epimerase/dehydratase family protein [Gammaproteobacteria bacterium]|nr:NAD-dependent epimerase/dehydratase family protein [Gammaproteobacteria bacterium]MDH3411901.1 NAD-dependent epimerase/dehydratase family protein [Gammaproteobacteria bacterium]
MIVSVTGATGFIGRRLVQQLVARGDAVRILTRDRDRAAALPDSVAVVIGDLSRPGPVLERLVEGADVFFHLAGEVGDPSAMRAVHVEGTRALTEAAAGQVPHWVQLSSVGVYGPVRKNVVDEKHSLLPKGEYETTKAESDQLVLEKAARKAFAATLLRPSIVFGPGMRNRSLYQLMAMVDRGLFCFIGPPGASANYIDVDNVVAALILCGTTPAARNKAYNLSDFCTMEQFVCAIAAALGKPVPRLRIPEPLARAAALTLGKLPGFPLTAFRVDALTSRARYSTAQIEQDLGYAHRISIKEGLSRLVDYWKKREGDR